MNAHSRIFIAVVQLALLVVSGGCMTQSTIRYAKGDSYDAWINNTYGYNMHAQSLSDLQEKPHAAYYSLLPLSVPADIATSPVQLVVLVYCTSRFGFFQEIPN
jgi:hypothetical protein